MSNWKGLEHTKRRIAKLYEALPGMSLDESVPALLSDGRVYFRGKLYASYDFKLPIPSDEDYFEMPVILPPDAEKNLLEKFKT